MATTRDLFDGAGGAQPATPGSYGLPPSGTRLPDATRLGPVRLQVADLDRAVVSYALAAAGLADIMTVPPNVAYAEIYLDAMRAARDAGLELDQATAPARAPVN